MAAPQKIQHTPQPASEGPPLPTREETPYVVGRVAFLYLGFIAVMVMFGLRLYQLAVVQGNYFRSESENNFRTEVPILAPRGKIYDRNRLPLAINHSAFDIEMSPFNLKGPEIAATVERLAELLKRPQLKSKTKEVQGRYPRWETVLLASGLQLEEVLPVLEQGYLLPGVIVKRSYQRYYPAGEAAGNVTGHVGDISRTQLQGFLDRGYLMTEKVGKLNAELTFEDLLHGTNGVEVVFRDARGRPRSQPEITQQAVPGHTLILTLDLKLQQLAQDLLQDQNGAIVAIDPRDGAVLAMAQNPTYDPNKPRTGWQHNKITRGFFPPGSTFKIVTAAAGLMQGRSPLESYNCSGAYMLGSTRFPCHLKWGHDSENLYDALQHSCNVYFYTWANKVGETGMVDMASAFGFGEPTGFELAAPGAESAAHLARPGIDTIYRGSLLQMGIGQGNMITVTPLQLARAYAALTNGGYLMRPRIVERVETSIGEEVRVEPFGRAQPQRKLPISDEMRKEILEGLWRVVHLRGGTGSHAGIKPEWLVGGKTGTAETGVRTLPAHAWFAGFAPFDNPEILVVVLIEQAGHGGDVAAPVARQLFAQYFGQPEPQVTTVAMQHAADAAAAAALR